MNRFRMAVPIVALAIMLTACPAGNTSTTPNPSASSGSSASGNAGATIEVTSLWGGAEAAAFQAVLDAFTAKTGINVTYTSVRTDYSTVLSNRIEQNDAPDVAIIPGIGFLRSFAKDGKLVALKDLGIDDSKLHDAYLPNLADMGTSVGAVDGTAYAVMVKLNSKSTIWYDPSRFSANSWQTPTDWDGLVALTNQIKAAGKTPWGLGAGDSWTLTDWFESIYLRNSGEQAYDKLFSKDGDWTDQSVKDAIKMMQDLLTNDNVAGGLDGALATAFVDGIGLVFSANPTAEMYYEGGFVGGIATGDVNTDLKVGQTIDFFDFPEINGSGAKITIGGDVMAALTDEPRRRGVHAVPRQRRGRQGLGGRQDHHLADERRDGQRLPRRDEEGGDADRQLQARSLRRVRPSAGWPRSRSRAAAGAAESVRRRPVPQRLPDPGD